MTPVRLLGYLVLVLIAAFIVGLVVYWLVTLVPFPPFSTYGKIYVSSPEVYTRERLVNDRYEQDFWYKKNLAVLDETPNILAGSIGRRIALDLASGTGTSSAPQPAPTVPTVTAAEEGSVPFALAFKVKAAIRDAIRQLILENTLDDRHDLTGNSIYGLKFDTTIVPGDNTHARASVDISVEVPHPFPKSTPDVAGQLPDLLKLYFDADSSTLSLNPHAEIQQSYLLYKNWIASVTSRLDNYSIRAHTEEASRQAKDASTAIPTDDKATPVCGESRKVTVAALESVLGIKLDVEDIPEDSPVPNALTELPLPVPWRGFITISRLPDRNCANPVRFVAGEAIHVVAVFDRNGPVAPDKVGYQDIGIRDDKWIVGGIASDASAIGTVADPWTTSAFIDQVMNKNWAYQTCPATSGCDNFFLFPLPSGFFNFVAQASQWDAYVYALFPKSDAEAFLANAEQSVTASGSADGAGAPLAGLLSFGQAVKGYTTKDLLVGYGDGQGGQSGQDSVRFGWVTGPATSAMQNSELVLLSVPGWSNQLTLHVSLGWLDRNGTHVSNEQIFKMAVRLPSDYEAFDTFIAGQQQRLLPRIADDFVDDTPLQACKPADIIVPGYRLWRSTVVTLGAQQADRIVVLPNMQGVIAHFNQIAYPALVAAKTDASLDLRVWTSEGEASVAKPVDVQTIPLQRFMGGCPTASPDSSK